MEQTIGSAPRLPLWGHLSFSADGRHTHLFRDPGADNVDAALSEISAFVSKSGDIDAPEVRVKVTPVGTPRSTPAARTLMISGCDPVFGLSDDQKRRVLAALDGRAAPSVEIVFVFKHDD